MRTRPVVLAFCAVCAALSWAQIKVGVPTAPPPPKSTAPAKPKSIGAVRRAPAETGVARYDLGLKTSLHSPWALPSPAIEKLANGATVLLQPNGEVPLVHGILAIKGGSAADPINRKGISDAFLLTLLDGGTQTKTSEQFRAAVEEAGLRLNGVVRPHLLELSFQCETSQLERALDLLHEILTQPQLRRSGLEAAKARFRTGVANRNKSINDVTRREADIAANGVNSSWDRKPELADVAAISREDMVAIARQRLTPARVVIGLAGHFDPTAVRERLARTLGAWQAPTEDLPPERRKVPTESRIHVANLPSSPTARIEIVYPLQGPAGSLTAEQSAALLIFAQLLRPSADSKFTALVRPFLAEGGSYALQTGTELNSAPAFRFVAAVRPREAVQAALKVNSEIELLRTAKIEDYELTEGKDRFITQLHFDLARPDAALRVLTIGFALGLPADHLASIQRAASAMTAASYVRHLQEAIDPRNAQIVIAGDPRDFRMAPEDSGIPVTNLNMEIAPAPPEKFRDDPESERLGKEWLAKWRAAAGGDGKLAVADASWTYDSKLFTAAEAVAIQQKVSWMPPGAYRQEQKAAFGESILFYDGKIGWTHSTRGIGPIGPVTLEQIKGELFRMHFRLPFCDRIEGCKVVYAGSGVLQFTDKEGFRVEVTLDPVTNLPESYSFLERRSDRGTYLRIVERFSDYRPVNGVLIAHKTDVEQEGTRFAEFVMRDLKINSGLTLEEIGKRP